MTLVSTSALRKITFVVLATALLTFSSAEIHKRIIVPRQQQVQDPTPSPTPCEACVATESIIGYFKEWEQIQDSKDKYILLTDRQTGQLLPKVRVVSGEKSPYGEMSSFFSAEVKAKTVELVEEVVLNLITERITPEEFEGLVQSGDTVKLFLKKPTNEEDKVTDQNGHFLAEKIWFVRE